MMVRNGWVAVSVLGAVVAAADAAVIVRVDDASVAPGGAFDEPLAVTLEVTDAAVELQAYSLALTAGVAGDGVTLTGATNGDVLPATNFAAGAGAFELQVSNDAGTVVVAPGVYTLFTAEFAVDSGLPAGTVVPVGFSGVFESLAGPAGELSVTYEAGSISIVPEPTATAVIWIAGLLLWGVRPRRAVR